jgi:DNA-binding NarL/FixJ family response regulator
MSDLIGAPLVANATGREGRAMPDASALRVLIVGAAAEDREALRERVEGDGMVASGEAADAEDASAIAIVAHPDIVLVSDRPPLDGVAAAAVLRAAEPAARVVLIGADAPDSRLLAAVHAGAAGYLHGDPGSPGLTRALLDAAAGRSAFPRHVEALVIASLHDACD